MEEGDDDGEDSGEEHDEDQYNGLYYAEEHIPSNDEDDGRGVPGEEEHFDLNIAPLHQYLGEVSSMLYSVATTIY